MVCYICRDPSPDTWRGPLGLYCACTTNWAHEVCLAEWLMAQLRPEAVLEFASDDDDTDIDDDDDDDGAGVADENGDGEYVVSTMLCAMCAKPYRLTRHPTVTLALRDLRQRPFAAIVTVLACSVATAPSVLALAWFAALLIVTVCYMLKPNTRMVHFMYSMPSVVAQDHGFLCAFEWDGVSILCMLAVADFEKWTWPR